MINAIKKSTVQCIVHISRNIDFLSHKVSNLNYFQGILKKVRLSPKIFGNISGSPGHLVTVTID